MAISGRVSLVTLRTFGNFLANFCFCGYDKLSSHRSPSICTPFAAAHSLHISLNYTPRQYAYNTYPRSSSNRPTRTTLHPAIYNQTRHDFASTHRQQRIWVEGHRGGTQTNPTSTAPTSVGYARQDRMVLQRRKQSYPRTFLWPENARLVQERLLYP